MHWTCAAAAASVGTCAVVVADLKTTAVIANQVGKYVSSWLQYQSLWDMPVSAVKTRLGTDVSLWCQLLNEAKAARAVVENSNREKAFGPAIIDYSSGQAKVLLDAAVDDDYDR